MRPARAIAATGSLAVLLTATVAGTAAAQPPEKGTIDDSFTRVEEDFCGSGQDVEIATTVQGRYQVTLHGPDGVPYYLESLRVEETLTLLGDEPRVIASSVDRVLNKDLHVVQEGDGTLTIAFLATGASTLYDAEGTPIARNPGQIRQTINIDLNGTPDDPTDDDVTLVSVDKESTGRSDDYCEALLPLLGS
ncbi:hypothetical protein SAMN04488107_2378 [Geodermatophilus saharensis]|uniref:Uncharacterized protein n=1 Tax=Geodermatophilus saharensis TaxID=1137994 RepID=A0A239E683_9ACTN|nr:hypothetical protein [Geodermatophilus saharensis]SNS39533.1 hypothetical protein SAMN04488107_2378 [Geodermatophilus saharensis]